MTTAPPRLSRDERESRVLDTAADLFYRRGVHEVGMDELVRASGLAKASVYRLFPTKDALIGAYLQRLADIITAEIDDEVAASTSPTEALHRVIRGAARPIDEPGFRGCPFNNASIEFADADHPARRVARDYRSGLLERVRRLAGEVGSPELGAQLAVLIDGAYVSAAHLGPDGPARSGFDLAHHLIDLATGDAVQKPTGLPELPIETIAQWHDWLNANHDSSNGVWVTTWKKGHRAYVPVSDLVDEAICFGWVDSRPRIVDSERSQRLITPRRAGSSWSRVNKQRVARLTKAGRMAPAGLAAVRAAKKDGSWTALDQVENLTEPADLRSALDRTTAARSNWEAFPRSTKRAILEWIGTAKTDATRAARIQQTATEAARGRRANQWRQPQGR